MSDMLGALSALRLYVKITHKVWVSAVVSDTITTELLAQLVWRGKHFYLDAGVPARAAGLECKQ